MLSIRAIVGVVAQGGHAVELNAGHAGENAQVFGLETVTSATVDLVILWFGGDTAEGIPAAVELALGMVVSAPGTADDVSHAPPSVGVLGWCVGRRICACFDAF